MNNVIQQLIDRKSVRQFTDKPISNEDKDLIITAASNAPSAGNMQLYSIIDVTDEKVKEKLSVTCDNQPFIKEAKMVLVFLADYRKWYLGFKEVGEPRKIGPGDIHLALADANIAAQNAVTAAWSLGIGSCYIGDISEQYEEVTKLLKLPEYIVPASMVVFGYPTENQLERVKPERVKNKYLVFENEYRDFNAEEFKDMWSYKTGPLEYEEYMKRFLNRKYNSEFCDEMNRSMKEYLKDIK